MKKDSFVSPSSLNKQNLIELNYGGKEISFNEDGWFNATDAADRFGKRVQHYLDNAETQDYINALCDENNRNSGYFIRAKRGRNGGTWFHPDLAAHGVTVKSENSSLAPTPISTGSVSWYIFETFVEHLAGTV
ncbi:MAG: KilA-N domain-containing protein [Pseudomonadota bacterium]